LYLRGCFIQGNLFNRKVPIAIGTQRKAQRTAERYTS